MQVHVLQAHEPEIDPSATECGPQETEIGPLQVLCSHARDRK